MASMVQRGDTFGSVLVRVFGVPAFRPHQEGIVKSIAAGRDVMAILPTGSGKSLCFQMPSLFRKGVTIVVTPLIALMQDQVRGARARGIPATRIDSTMTPKQIQLVCDAMQLGRVKIVYISPERVMVPAFQAVLQRTNIATFIFDEAHCVTEWGADFRPKYYQAAEYISNTFEAPIAAFTATATMDTQKLIVQKLGMDNPYQVRGDFDRPNLFYNVQPKHEDGMEQMVEYLQTQEGVAGIVYRKTRKSVESTVRYLLSNGISCAPYHAGMQKKARSRNQEDFITGEVPVIVATIAFGMGIDKPDIRFVIHADIPQNVEGYYQEVGRAGRDGKQSHCMFLFSESDLPNARYFVEQSRNRVQQIKKYQQLLKVVEYAKFNNCRRKALLSYFGQAYSGNCGMCDICRKKGNL